MESFTIVNRFQQSTIITKLSILDDWEGTGYVSEKVCGKTEKSESLYFSKPLSY